MRRNRQLLGSIALLAVTGGITGATTQFFQEELKEIRMKDVLDFPGFPVVRVVGVCDITATGAVCWDNSGKPFQSLSESIYAYYLSNSGTAVSMRPGKKNRWIVMEQEDNSEDKEWLFGGRAGGGTQGSLRSWRQDRNIEWHRVELNKEDRIASIRVAFSTLPKRVEIALKKGSFGELPDERLTLTDFGKRKTTETGFNEPYPLPYRVFFKREPRKGGRIRSTLFPEVYATDRRPIFNIDGRGKPVESTSSSMKGRVWAHFISISGDPRQIVYATNIDPRYIGKIVYKERLTRSVVFEDLPADPLLAEN